MDIWGIWSQTPNPGLLRPWEQAVRVLPTIALAGSQDWGLYRPSVSRGAQGCRRWVWSFWGVSGDTPNWTSWGQTQTTSGPPLDHLCRTRQMPMRLKGQNPCFTTFTLFTATRENPFLEEAVLAHFWVTPNLGVLEVYLGHPDLVTIVRQIRTPRAHPFPEVCTIPRV